MASFANNNIRNYARILRL